MSPPPRISRRTLAFGAAATACTAAVAGALYEVPKLFKRRARGEYAEFVNRLADPEQAAIVGRAIHPRFSDVGPPAEELAADYLKKGLAKRTLADLAHDDTKESRGLAEADGWVIPITVAALCVLAAQAV